MRAATEGNLPPVMPQGNLVEVLGREVRQGSPGELMVESSPSRQRRPPCKTNEEMSDEAADAAALTYLLTTYLLTYLIGRLVKWVFQHPIALRVVEFWLPAQHDSGDTAVAAGWQRLDDAAAPRGLDDADRYPIPWDSILGVLDDPPSPVCFNGSVVFKLNAFMEGLYDMTLGQSSALGGWVLEQGFDASTPVRVYHDASVSLSKHRQAAYLRMLLFLPRVYFDVPDCRFCSLFQGNEQSHMCACVELYGRQCRAVRA